MGLNRPKLKLQFCSWQFFCTDTSQSYSNFKTTAQKSHYFALKWVDLRKKLLCRYVTCQGVSVQKSCQLQKWSSKIDTFLSGTVCSNDGYCSNEILNILKKSIIKDNANCQNMCLLKCLYKKLPDFYSFCQRNKKNHD